MSGGRSPFYVAILQKEPYAVRFHGREADIFAAISKYVHIIAI